MMPSDNFPGRSMNTLDIQLRDVHCAKPGAGGVLTPILRGVSVTVPAGQCVGLIGASGSGKTTILRLLNRLEDPTGGEILYGGQPLPQLPVTELRRRLALVNQRTVMFPGTVLDNVLVPDTLRERPGDAARARQMLDLMRLPSELADRDAQALSTGQQARVQLARILYLDPEVLMLDESMANLDPKVAGEILDDLHRLVADAGKTVLHVSHKLEHLQFCARVLYLADGLIAADGPPAEIMAPDGPAAALLRREAS